MSERDKVTQERRLEDVLKSQLDVRAKIRRIIQLGFSERMAAIMVAQAEATYRLPAYYERIGPLVRSK